MCSRSPSFLALAGPLKKERHIHAVLVATSAFASNNRNMSLVLAALLSATVLHSFALERVLIAIMPAAFAPTCRRLLFSQPV